MNLPVGDHSIVYRRIVEVPTVGMVLLVGPSGSGKSTFASRHFGPYEVVSSDTCRAIISDDAMNQAVTPEAFALLRYITSRRLILGRLVVIDATNLKPFARARNVELARRHQARLATVVFDMPEEICLARDRRRGDRTVGADAIHRQQQDLRRFISSISGEDLGDVIILDSPEEVESVIVNRVPGYNPQNR